MRDDEGPRRRRSAGYSYCRWQNRWGRAQRRQAQNLKKRWPAQCCDLVGADDGRRTAVASRHVRNTDCCSVLRNLLPLADLLRCGWEEPRGRPGQGRGAWLSPLAVSAQGAPIQDPRLAHIPNLLNTSLKGANTDCNENPHLT